MKKTSKAQDIEDDQLEDDLFVSSESEVELFEGFDEDTAWEVRIVGEEVKDRNRLVCVPFHYKC